MAMIDSKLLIPGINSLLAENFKLHCQLKSQVRLKLALGLPFFAGMLETMHGPDSAKYSNQAHVLMGLSINSPIVYSVINLAHASELFWPGACLLSKMS